jgi:lysophospholipase L1-like esterase
MPDKRILLIGDSITEGFAPKTLLPEFRIINKGISGNNSGDLLKRLKRDVISHHPDYVFVLIGTNDLAQGFTNEEIITNIEIILQTMVQSLVNSTVFITSILPTRNNDPRPNKRISVLNSRLKNIAEKLRVEYLALDVLFRDNEGALRSDLTEDGLHLNNKAYEIWADFLRTHLKNFLNTSTSGN